MEEKSGALDALISLSKDLASDDKRAMPSMPEKACKCACCGAPCSKCDGYEDDDAGEVDGEE